MKQPVLTVSVAPFWHSGAGIARNSYFTMMALLPAAFIGVLHYGIGALAVLCLSIASCMAAEALMQKIMGRPVTLADGSAALTGMLLALLLPAGVPWWLVVVGALCAIILGKQIFGGLGSNPMNATLVGWIILRISWAIHMDPDVALINLSNLTGLSTIAALRGGYGQTLQLSDIWMGNVVGPIGSASLAVLLGGLALVVMHLVFKIRLIKWEVSISFLAGALVGALTFGSMILPEGAAGTISSGNLALLMLFSGPIMLGAFFLAPDSSSSPSQPIGMAIFGFCAGLLAILIRVKGFYYDAGVAFAILLMNLVYPLLDKIRPQARGKE